MLLEKYEMPELKKNGKKDWRARLKCDECELIFEERWVCTLDKQRKRKEHLCRACLNKLMSKISSERMTLTRAKQSPEERRKISSCAGKKSQSTGKPSQTWFNRYRWDSMS